jgi:hypothetical protein
MMSTPIGNVTKEGIEVKPGQIWIDLDKRMRERSVIVEIVEDGQAYCRTAAGKRTRIAIRRMHKGGTGWRIKS